MTPYRLILTDRDTGRVSVRHFDSREARVVDLGAVDVHQYAYRFEDDTED
jgi:hypothetical protein